MCQHCYTRPNPSPIPLTLDTQCPLHLDTHLYGEECEDDVIECLKDAAAGAGTDEVSTRLVQPQGNTVEQDDTHAEPLEPRADRCQGIHIFTDTLFAILTYMYYQQHFKSSCHVLMLQLTHA